MARGLTRRLLLSAGMIGIAFLLWNHAKLYDYFAGKVDQRTKAAEIASSFENSRLKLFKLPDYPIINEAGRYANVDGVWIAEAPGPEHSLLQPQQVQIRCMINALFDEHKKGECAELTVTFGAMKGMVSIMGPEETVYEVTKWDRDSLVASYTDDCRLHVLTMAFALARVSVTDIPTNNNKQRCMLFTQTNSYRLVSGQYYVDTSAKNDNNTDKPSR